MYFENVGGEHMEAALTAANRFARFALCGMISQYNVAGMPAGPRNIMFAVGKSIRLEGFIVANHFNLLPEFQKDMSGWIREGKLSWKETVEHGIENAPTAFLKLFKGENLGKMLVKLGDANSYFGNGRCVPGPRKNVSPRSIWQANTERCARKCKRFTFAPLAGDGRFKINRRTHRQRKGPEPTCACSWDKVADRGKRTRGDTTTTAKAWPHQQKR